MASAGRRSQREQQSASVGIVNMRHWIRGKKIFDVQMQPPRALLGYTDKGASACACVCACACACACDCDAPSRRGVSSVDSHMSRLQIGH